MKVIDPCGCFPTGRHYPGIAHLLQVRAVGIVDEIDPAAQWLDCRIAFLDTETTGTDSKVDRVIEVGVVIGQGGEVIERRGWLLNPGIPIPKESTAIHHISDEMVANEPRFQEVADDILAMLEGAIPAAYNAPFDRGFLHAELRRAGGLSQLTPPAACEDVSWLDPLVFAREIYKGQGESRALGAVAERLGVALDNAHRASDDAEAGLRVLYALGQDDRLPRGYAALVREQRRLERIQQEARRFWRK